MGELFSSSHFTSEEIGNDSNGIPNARVKITTRKKFLFLSFFDLFSVFHILDSFVSLNSPLGPQWDDFSLSFS